MSTPLGVPPTPPATATTAIPDPAHLASFTIVPANDDQIVQQERAAFVPWSRGNSFEAFQKMGARERDEGEWTMDGAYITWALVRRDDVQGELYASCETYRRKAMIKRRNSEIVEETWMYGVASVVTPVKHLRKGYATHLLRLLHYHLAEPSLIPPFPAKWGAPPPPLPSSIQAALPRGIASILWSDVGSSFYSRCTVGPDRPGWVVNDHKSHELAWKILPSSKSMEEDTRWKWLYRADLPNLAETLSAASRAHLEASDSTSNSLFRCNPLNKGTLGFVPTRGGFAEAEDTSSEPVGVQSTSAQGGETIVLFTTHNIHIAHRLLITYIHNLQPKDLDSLLRVLDTRASEAGRTEGWIWDLDPSSELGEAWAGMAERDVKSGRRTERMGHLLAMAWYGPEEEQGDADLVDGQMWNWC